MLLDRLGQVFRDGGVDLSDTASSTAHVGPDGTPTRRKRKLRFSDIHTTPVPEEVADEDDMPQAAEPPQVDRARESDEEFERIIADAQRGQPSTPSTPPVRQRVSSSLGVPAHGTETQAARTQSRVTIDLTTDVPQ